MDKILEKIREYGVMPLVTLDDPQDAYVLGRALTDCSLPIVEITFRSGAAEEAIRILRSTYPDMLVGAGTVLDADMAERAIKAGAQFVLAPGMNPGMIEYCLEEEIPVFPGCMTPTDLGQAQNLGLKVVKIFPFMQMGGIPMLKASPRSVGVIHPGNTGIPSARQNSIMPGFIPGASTNCAPALIARSAVSASSTVPAPTNISG